MFNCSMGIVTVTQCQHKILRHTNIKPNEAEAEATEPTDSHVVQRNDLSTREDQCQKGNVPGEVTFYDTVRSMGRRGVSNNKRPTNEPSNQTKKGKLSIEKASANSDSIL